MANIGQPAAKTVLTGSVKRKGANSVLVTVDFGSDSGPISPPYTATASVSATWAYANETIVCAPYAQATTQHMANDGQVEGLSATTSNIIPGTGFTLNAYSPLRSYGQYVFECVGL